MDEASRVNAGDTAGTYLVSAALSASATVIMLLCLSMVIDTPDVPMQNNGQSECLTLGLPKLLTQLQS